MDLVVSVTRIIKSIESRGVEKLADRNRDKLCESVVRTTTFSFQVGLERSRVPKHCRLHNLRARVGLFNEIS